MVLAEATTGGQMDIPSLIGTGSAVAALVWYLWFNTSKTIPGIIDKHAETINKVTGQFSTELAEERKVRSEHTQKTNEALMGLHSEMQRLTLCETLKRRQAEQK